MVEAPQLSKVFQGNFTTVTRVIVAVNNFKMRLLAVKKKNGQRLHHFLQQMEGNDSFGEITILSGGNDLKEFEAKKQAVLDDILENVEERFGYLENGPLLKAAGELDPDVWPKDRIELSTYGDAEIELLANYYEDHLLRAGCELHQILRKWSSVKSYVSLHLSSRCNEEIFATIFRS